MLKLQNIRKTFNPGTVNEKPALCGVDLDLAAGDFATIVGSNGAGKSTLFNAIAGSFMVDSGRIELDGKDITYLAEHRRSQSIGRLFQDPLRGTAPHMTIEENLAIAYLRQSRSRFAVFSRITKADRALFRDQLAQLGMGLEDRMNSPVGLLSGGQRQALTMLMATMVTPKLLLLQAALDPATADRCWISPAAWWPSGITCLMVTHNMHQALDLADDGRGQNRARHLRRGRAHMTVDGRRNPSPAKAGRALDNGIRPR